MWQTCFHKAKLSARIGDRKSSDTDGRAPWRFNDAVTGEKPAGYPGPPHFLSSDGWRSTNTAGVASSNCAVLVDRVLSGMTDALFGPLLSSVPWPATTRFVYPAAELVAGPAALTVKFPRFTWISHIALHAHAPAVCQRYL